MRAVFILPTLAITPAHAQGQCTPCHPKQSAAFARTPMGRSLSTAIQSGQTQFTHTLSGSRFSVGPGAMHTALRSGLMADYPLAFAIGSGSHAQGYAVAIGGRFFQSPIAAYRQGTSWNVAPGYEGITAPDFNRPITNECLLCHSSGDPQVREAITCHRCHGDPAAHVRQPSRQTIVNPARLPDAERDSVCEQCHLNGEARVTNPGKGFGNFQPGQRLEEAFTVFVYDRPKSGLKVVSHAEQLALSACRKADAKLWCGTCHQPHGEAISISGRCAQCHPALSGKHPAAAASCESCHMPKRPARDGGHTPFTDHRIQRNSIPQPGAASPTMLRAWRQPVGPALAERNLGLAYVIAGERDGSALFLNRGYELLAAVFPKFSQDVDVLANLGMVLFLKDRRADAEKLLRAALAARPSEPGLWEKLGVILKSAGQKERAALALEKAIALDPARETAYHLLAEMESDPKKRRAVLERYLLFNPKSLIAREALMKLPVP